VVLGEPLWAEHAVVDGMMGIAADAGSFAPFDADEHSASYGAIPASRRDPVIWNLLRRSEAHDGIGGVGIFFTQDIETELALEGHAAALRLPR